MIAKLLTLGAGICLLPLISIADKETFSLEEAVQAAIANNYGLLIDSLNPKIAEAGVNANESIFDTEIFANGTVSDDENVTPTNPLIINSESRRISVGARRQFSTGTIIQLETALNRSESSTRDPYSDADIELTLRQPLLKGFGFEANLVDIRKAKAALQQSEQAFRANLREVILSTEQSYWEVSRLQQTLAYRQSSMKVAEELFTEAVEKERIGTATRIDVLQARANKAQQKENIIVARQLLENAFDRLFEEMGTLMNYHSVSFDLSVIDLPDPRTKVWDFSDLWSNAQRIDPNIQATESILLQRELEKRASGLRDKPTLDLVLSGGFGGQDEDSNAALEDAFEAEETKWSVGLEFSYPLGNRSLDASYRIASNQVTQAEWAVLQSKQTLYRELRAAWRDWQTGWDSYEATTVSVELQEASFVQEREKYEQGVSVFRDVLEVQRDLDDARIRQLQAKTDLIISRITLEALSGALLEKYGLQDNQN